MESSVIVAYPVARITWTPGGPRGVLGRAEGNVVIVVPAALKEVE